MIKHDTGGVECGTERDNFIEKELKLAVKREMYGEAEEVRYE